MNASKLDKRRRPNPQLRIAALVWAAILLVAMLYSMSTSLAHSDVIRPTLEVSTFPGLAGADVAASEALYVSPNEEKLALRHLVKRGEPLFCAGTKNYASITFDDGPSATTPQLMALLKKAGIPATFFVIGKNGSELPNNLKLYPPRGAIGNHTWNHANLPTLSKQDVTKELTDTQTLINTSTGQNNKMMRPPYGARDVPTDKTIDKLGYAEMLWSADSQDALGKPADVVAENVTNGLGPGAVILMHDGPATTLTALKKTIIPAIKKSGLTMLTIPELLVLNPVSDAQLDLGPRGCAHAGKVNVSGYFASPQGER